MRFLQCFLLPVLIFPLGVYGCGIKPDDLSPPESAQESPFPKTYPDPTTDPKPE